MAGSLRGRRDGFGPISRRCVYRRQPSKLDVRLRPEPFGYAVLGQGQVMPVSSEPRGRSKLAMVVLISSRLCRSFWAAWVGFAGECAILALSRCVDCRGLHHKSRAHRLLFLLN